LIGAADGIVVSEESFCCDHRASRTTGGRCGHS
jgi:hypothetical protein